MVSLIGKTEKRLALSSRQGHKFASCALQLGQNECQGRWIVLEIDNAEELIEAAKTGEMKYLLVNLVGKRARALNSGEKPLVDVPMGTDLADQVLAELHADKLILGKKEPKAAAPPTPPPPAASEEEE